MVGSFDGVESKEWVGKDWRGPAILVDRSLTLPYAQGNSSRRGCLIPPAVGVVMSSADPHPADDHPAAPRPAAARTLWRRLLPFGLLAVLAGSLWGAYEWQRSRPPPRADTPAAEA